MTKLKGIIVNQTFYSLYKGLIEVTLTVPLKDNIVENIVQV